MQFQPQRRPVKRENLEECKIRIKETKYGREIKFSGNCSKEQIEVAKESIGTSRVSKDEEL